MTKDPDNAARVETGSDRLERGEVVSGRFVVEAPIGSGGMGRIYLARQRPFNRPVALKVMHRDASKTRELVERFFQEASTVSHLAHPNTVTVYDFGRTDAGLLYIAMELVDGVSLGDEIKRRRALPADEAIPYAVQIAQSLGEAHHKGLVHRDLKPDNVMVCRPEGSDPFVKVLDFGIAKVLGKDASWTEVGNIVGTPFYMAPEQAKGQEVDGRTDLYSLGCCLYEMLVGNPPFMKESPVQVLMAHQNAPVPELPPGFHPALNNFLQRALAKDPNDRPDDAATFVAELLATIIEMRSEDSYSGYTPSPQPFDRSTRESPIPMSAREARETAVSPLPVASSVSSQSRQQPRNRDEVEEDEEIANARTLDSPVDAVDRSADLSATPTTPTNPWMWFSVLLVVVMVVGAAASLTGTFDEPAPEEPAVTTPSPDAPRKVTLEAKSEPEGAIVFVDDTAIGRTPIRHDLPVGEEVELRFEIAGYDPFETAVTPEKSEPLSVFAPLERARLQVRVMAPFDGTQLTIDEKSYGSLRAGTPREVKLPFPARELVIRFEADGFDPYIARFDPSVLDEQLDVSASEDDFVPAKTESESEE